MEMPSFLQSKQEIQLNNSRGQYFKNKKNLSIISLVVLLLAIPLTIWLLQTSKIFAPKASGGPIELVSDPNSCVVSVDPAKVTCGTFPIKLTSPLGPNAEPGTSSAVLKKDITTPLSRILANSKSLIDGLGKGFVIESVSAQATDAILAANPNPCNIASGQETCSSTITWNAGNKTNVRITIRENPGSLFATGASGTQVAPWIRSTGATFDLYSGDTLLKSLVVTGNPSSSTASPAPSTSTSTPSVAPTVSTLTNGLIAYWNLNETSGDIANDYTGANNAAILNTRTALGKFGQARNFAAPWDYIQVTSPKNFLRSGVTASAWVNTVGSSKKQYITWQGNSWSLFLSSSGIPTFSIAKADGGYIVCDGTTPISNNSWHLITGSFDGGNLKVYSDGVLQNTCAFSNTLRGYENSFWIGYGGSSQEPFIGNIDEVAIWNRALTQTEVTGMANGALPGQSSGGSGGTGSALITASPAICNIPTGGETCSSTISWNAGSATNVKISIRENPGSLFATGATGTQVAPWIRTSGATFDLYSGNSLISSVFVKGVDGSGSPAPTSGLGLITASPNPCNITSGNEMCSSTISWNAGSRTDVKISIRENPGSVFATGASGTQVAPWIRSTGATFDLYSGNVLVDSLFVKGVDPNASPSPRASGVGTVKYRIAESEAGLQNAEFKPYNQDPLFIDFTFSDVNPGSKQIWAEFIGLDGSSKKEHIFVELAEPDPVVTSLDCSMDISKQNLKLTLNGSRFGTGSGKVTANAKEAQVLTWQNDQVSATVAPEGSLDDGKLFKVILTRSDGKALPEINCQVNTTLISLGARLFCREPGKFDVNGVKATLVDEAGNKVNEEVTIDKDGIINGLKTKLQVGKRYVISVKAPFSLRRNALFTAANGTNIVTPEDGSSFVLPIGDIAPVVLNDGKINTLDHAEIVRQWAVFGNTIKTADFNKDTKVNSIDWACMRYDFNKEDDVIPASAALPSPSPTVPGSSVTPTQSASPSASASVTTSPSPVASGQRSAYFLIEPFGGGSYKNDDEFIVNINLWSQNEAANLFSLKLSFDPSILEVSRIEKGTALTTWAEDNFDNQTGKISLTAGLPNPGLKTVEGADPLMAKIIFKGKKVGTTTVSVSSDSKIYSNSDNQNILTSLLSSQIAITN